MLLALGTLAFLGLMLVSLRVANERDSSPLVARRIAPGFELQTLDGLPVRLDDLRGKVVLIHFWATWCPPCVEEAPELADLARSLSGQGFALVAISVDEDRAKVQAFFRAGAPPYVVALDSRASVARRYGTYKYPESYLLSPEGAIVERYVGPQTWSDPAITNAIQALLREGPSERR